MMSEKISRMRKPILLPLAGVILLITGLSLWALSSQYDHDLTELIQVQRQTVTSQFNHELKDKAELMSELAKQVRSDPEIVEAWKNRDRKRLLNLSRPYLERYSEAYGISHLYFIEPDQTCFLRTHRPDVYGGKIERIILERAIQSGLTQSGIELGKYGTFTLGSANPWVIDNSIMGFVELGEEISGIIDRIARYSSVGLIATIDKHFLDRDMWEKGMKRLGHEWEWESVPYCAVVGQTIDFIPLELSEWTRPINSSADDESFSTTHDGRTYDGSSLRVLDASGRPVGHLFILSDVTILDQSYRIKFGLILIVGLVLAGLTVAFMDNFLAKKQRELEKSSRIKIQFDQLRQTLREVEQTNRKLNRTQRLAQLGYWELSLDGRNIFASEEAFKIFNIKQDGLIIPVSRMLKEVFPEDRAGVFESLKVIIAGGRKRGIDFRLTPRDGKGERVIYAQATLIRSLQGVPVRVEGFVQDITDNIKTDAQKRQLDEKLKRADRMNSLGLMAGGVAHDLNNMLGPIVGYPELLLRKLPQDSPYRKQIQRIGNAAREAADVVKDLLTLARRGRYEMASLDLNRSVESYYESANCCRLREEQTGVEMSLNLADNLGLINGSVSHIGQAIMNLVVNAFDAMPTGGKLTVTTEQVTLEKLISGYTGIPQGDYVLLRVADTGMGIPKDALDRIFEPYYSKKKMGRSGSGLGLAVVYGIVKDHDGFYDVFSEEGKYTEIILYFPMASEPAKIAIDEEPDVGGHETILVVDDTPIQLEVAGTLLSSHGYEVHTASSGEEAIEFIKSRKADLILLDMMMENGLDGLDTYREIIKIMPGQKAVLVTGASITKRFLLAQELGAGPILRKPFTLKDVDKAVREVLDARTETVVS